MLHNDDERSGSIRTFLFRATGLPVWQVLRLAVIMPLRRSHGIAALIRGQAPKLLAIASAGIIHDSQTFLAWCGLKPAFLDRFVHAALSFCALGV